MKEASDDLTARESLDIIAAMIQAAKGNIQRNNFYFLFWGWVVVIANIGMYVLRQIEYPYFFAVWLITIPAWIVTFYKIRSAKREDTTTTHFDKVTTTLWITYGITLFCLVFFGYKISYHLNPVILLVTSVPTIVTGVILNFRPIIIGGMTFWLSGIICFLVAPTTQPLVGALAIVIGFLIPGYWLRNRREANV